MATVIIGPLRMAVGMICGFHWMVRIFICGILPFITFITPAAQVLFWLLIFIPIYFTDNSLNKDENGAKNFNKAFKWSYGFYHVIFACIFIFMQYTTCRVNELIDESPLGMVI